MAITKEMERLYAFIEKLKEETMEKLSEKLDEINDEIIPIIEDKKLALEEKAGNRDSGENTESEQIKLDSYDSQLDSLENIVSSIDEFEGYFDDLLDNIEEAQSL